MKKYLFFGLMVSALLACEKENSLSKEVSRKLADTNVIVFKTAEISLGYFGDEEGAQILNQPKHAKSAGISIKNGERILFYTAEDNYTGTDTVFIKTLKGSDGASQTFKIDTLIIVLDVVKNNIHEKLMGKWNWKSTCGGFTGGCSYPNKNLKKQVEFTTDLQFIEKTNDSIINTITYQLLDSFSNQGTLTYRIQFGENFKTYIWFSGDKLELQKGDLVEEFEKVK